MSHWCEKYIGKPYRAGVFDCASLVSEVRREVFCGDLPSLATIERAASRLGRVAQLSDGIGWLVEPTESPEEGDVVLMKACGRDSHVGVFCIVNAEPCVLHAMENAGCVVLHKIRLLEPLSGCSISGYYKWK